MATPSRKILLADDNEANRLISRTILERSGHHVKMAENGSHVLSLANLTAYDLIVLDIVMPVIDGMRALRRLRRFKGPNQKTPVFALTTNCSAQDRQRYILAGFDSVLSKPLRAGDIESAIKRYISGRPLPFSDPERSSAVKDTPLLDNDIISQLTEMADADRLDKIQSRFWTSIERQCEVIVTNLPETLRGTSSHLLEFRRAVHTIKGASANIGLAQLSKICRQLQNTPPANIPPLMAEMVDSLSMSRHALNEALSRPGELNSAMQMSGEH